MPGAEPVLLWIISENSSNSISNVSPANKLYTRKGCYYKSLLFYVQKMNTLMFTARENASQLSPFLLRKMMNWYAFRKCWMSSKSKQLCPSKTPICELGTLQIFFNSAFTDLKKNCLCKNIPYLWKTPVTRKSVNRVHSGCLTYWKWLISFKGVYFNLDAFEASVFATNIFNN